MKMKEPRLHLLWEGARGFLSIALVSLPEYIRPAAPWLHPGFVSRNHDALIGYPSRVKLWGPLPSFQNNINQLNAERRLLALHALPSEPLREIRYPYVDRDLLEFMYAIPREQIVRVGRRRSLMRRALVGIVPDELLNRKRKAPVHQGSANFNTADFTSLVEIGQDMVSSSIGIMDPNRFWEAIRKVGHNHDAVSTNCLMRTLTMEFWLRHLTIQGVLRSPM
jgi:asparagine synthase (glutamine-hydrolysing)